MESSMLYPTVTGSLCVLAWFFQKRAWDKDVGTERSFEKWLQGTGVEDQEKGNKES